MTIHHDALRYSFCRACGKRGYAERGSAKKKMKLMNEPRLSIYYCRHGGDMWHIGHLWEDVVAGVMAREDILPHARREVR